MPVRWTTTRSASAPSASAGRETRRPAAAAGPRNGDRRRADLGWRRTWCVRAAKGHRERPGERAAPPEPERAEPVLPEGRIARVVSHGGEKARRGRRNSSSVQARRQKRIGSRVRGGSGAPPCPGPPAVARRPANVPAPGSAIGYRAARPSRSTSGWWATPAAAVRRRWRRRWTPPDQAGDLIQEGCLGEHREFAGEYRDPHPHPAPSTSATRSISARVV